MKRICFHDTNMSNGGGIQRVVSIIANELALTNEFEVYIISSNNANGDSFFPLHDKVKHICLKQNWSGSFISNWLSYVYLLFRFLLKTKIDTLIICDNIANMYSIPASLFLKTKLVNWDHFNSNETLGSKLMQPMRFITSIFCNKYICLTKKDQLNLEKRYGWLKKKNIQLYNPALTDSGKDITYDQHSKLIITAGHLTDIKGYDMLIEVANNVLHQTNWKWVICGEGPLRAFLEQKINDLNLQGKLQLLGSVSNINDYYAKSAIYVMTSRTEGFPLTLLEAQTFKLPIVAFDIFSGPSEIITNNTNGYLINCFDIQAMSDALIEIINNEERRVSFSESAGNNVLRFSLDKILRQWRQILN